MKRFAFFLLAVALWIPILGFSLADGFTRSSTTSLPSMETVESAMDRSTEAAFQVAVSTSPDSVTPGFEAVPLFGSREIQRFL